MGMLIRRRLDVKVEQSQTAELYISEEELENPVEDVKDVKDEVVDSEEESVITSTSSEYPLATGGGWFQLSNGTKLQGKEQAYEAENELEVGE